jgi:hypothetical protein
MADEHPSFLVTLAVDNDLAIRVKDVADVEANKLTDAHA